MLVRVRGITCCMLCVLFAERAEWVPGTILSGRPARETAQVRCSGNVTGDLAARVAGEWHTLALMADPSKASASCNAHGDDKAPGIV